MTDRIWQKSSFSGTGMSDSCLEVTADPTGRILFREGDRPSEVLTTTPAHWAAFLRAIKTGEAGPS
ncbi:DUF397 domain-containing protein [Streptomyces sp. RKAG293]|uniref:DUF397 domain-containing protein n=1 Tax=Streptomyces sp. RKAG293 TaxID=2893403 RepID=UPI0020331C69|nr:DUF397 domain-containing protein [Streptomyces sp. RKAG293]MCM2420961.1 DUF397 domain-containing protein [Streptomyces sp. RKAG293]